MISPYRLLSAMAILYAGLQGITINAAERINHAGRILGPLPTVTAPTLFNTAAADGVVSAMQIMPVDSAWNEVVSGRPVDPNSANVMAQIRGDLGSNVTLRVFDEMNYVLVPNSQPLVDLLLADSSESDLNGGTGLIARYPIPSNWPIEGWPSGRGSETLLHAQTTDDGGDRHSIIVVPGTNRIFETWRTVLSAGSPAWTANNSAIFPLDSNVLRPDTWTSGDAAGLPMFPALIRYDECERGVIEHALRIVVKKSRRFYYYPATHFASSIPATSVNYPAMGQRLRLKSSFSIPAGWTKQSKAVAQALKTYGAMVADNGNFFSVSACPDDRFPSGCFSQVQTIDITNFEAVVSTGATEGPRTPGAVPIAAAGSDQTVTLAVGATLNGSASGSGISVLWQLYNPATAPGSASFSSATSLTPHVTFSATGTYTLLLKVSDGLHASAYDAVVVTVTSGSGNAAPFVSAGSSQTVTLGAGASLDGTVTDDGLPSGTLTHGWTTDSGPGSVVFANASAIDTTASFSAAGVYVLRLSASDGSLSASATATITVNAASSGTGGSSGSSGGGGGGCGLGSGIAVLLVAASCSFSRRQRR